MFIIQMEQSNRNSNKPTKYAKIPLAKRIQLIKLVQQESYSISKASAILNIRPSTGKLIAKKYRSQGVFFEKKSDRQERLATPEKSEAEQEQRSEENIQELLNSLNRFQQLQNGQNPLNYFNQFQNPWFIVGWLVYCKIEIQNINRKELVFLDYPNLYLLPQNFISYHY